MLSHINAKSQELVIMPYHTPVLVVTIIALVAVGNGRLYITRVL